MVMGGLTLVPGCRRTVHTARQVGSVGKHQRLTGGWLSEGPDSTGARACKLAREVHREGPKSTVRLLYWICGPPTGFLLNEGVVGAVGRARVEVQQLGPLAPTDGHPTATPSAR